METATDQPPPLPAPARYRFSAVGLSLALVIIAACAVWVVTQSGRPKAAQDTPLRPNGLLNLSARYAVGVKGLMKMGGSWNPQLTEQMVGDMKSTMKAGEADALRLLLLKHWLNDSLPDANAWKQAAGEDAELTADATAFQKLMLSPADVAEEKLRELEKRHGWVTHLAEVKSLPDNDPRKQAVIKQGLTTAATALAGLLLVLMAGALGIGVWIVGLNRWRQGRIKRHLEPLSTPEGGVLIEGFALYLLLFLVLHWLWSLWRLPPLTHSLPALAAWLLGMSWPLLRGMKGAVWAQALGLHRGQGVLKEMGAGVIGWLAALPVMALSLVASTAITRYTGEVPSHPIVDFFAGSDWTRFTAVILAVVWAPVTEEIMFRGLLFPGLSARGRWLAGLLLSAFIFAVIHPQGWAGVPPIMTLAATFSLLRLWRQSLIAPMTAHAINNGSVCVVMLLM